MFEVLSVLALALACFVWFYVDKAAGGSCNRVRCGVCSGGGGKCSRGGDADEHAESTH